MRSEIYHRAEATPHKPAIGIYIRRRRYGTNHNLFRLHSTATDTDAADLIVSDLLRAADAEGKPIEVSVQRDKDTWMLPDRYAP